MSSQSDGTFWTTPEGEIRVGKVVTIGITFLILVTVVASSFVTIQPGTRGIVIELGKVKTTLSEGFYVLTPFTQSIQLMDIRTQKIEAPASAASKDLQIVSATVALNFHINPESVGTIYQNLGLNYRERVIDPAIQESVKASTAQYTAEELITKREIVKAVIRDNLRTRLSVYNIIVEDIAITNFDFSKQFNEAIEQKVTAEQNALTEQNRLKIIEFQAQQKIAEANGAAESVKKQADGEAYRNLATATAEAKAIEIKGEADATAIRVRGDALRQNPQLVNLEYAKAAQNWDGKLPVNMYGSAPLPFLNVGSQPVV